MDWYVVLTPDVPEMLKQIHRDYPSRILFFIVYLWGPIVRFWPLRIFLKRTSTFHRDLANKVLKIEIYSETVLLSISSSWIFISIMRESTFLLEFFPIYGSGSLDIGGEGPQVLNYCRVCSYILMVIKWYVIKVFHHWIIWPQVLCMTH